MVDMTWKNIRLTEKQIAFIKRHGKAQYSAETETEALRAILIAYFEERGLSFPLDHGQWGGSRIGSGRPRKPYATFDKRGG